MEAWLIQRCKFENRDYKTGIDSILDYDYMGSSEFEWGALPAALKRIRMGIENYTYININIEGKDISVFCKISQVAEIEQYLNELAKNKIQLKEFSAFDQYIKGDGHFSDRFDFWWDIDNDLMFWKKNEEFEMKFRKIIQTKTISNGTNL